VSAPSVRPAAGDVPISATAPYRVRFDECGPDGLVRTSALLRYAQDVAWIHAEQLDINRDWTRAHGLTWLVRAAEVAVLQPIPVASTLQVTTRLGGVRRIIARRRTEFHLGDGTLAGWGHTDWVVVDDRGLPARLPEDFLDRIAFARQGFEPCRVALPPEPSGATAIVVAVRPQDLDPLGHVNNGAYLDYLEEAVLAAGAQGDGAARAIPRIVRLEYIAPAGPGMRLRGATWPERTGSEAASWAWRMTSQDDGRELARGRLAGVKEETG
jgi:acyl-CoA thioesterase FadM